MPPPIFCLSFHAPYRCRHAGACCTAGWEVPVETWLYGRLEEAVRAGAVGSAVPPGLALTKRADLPDGLNGVLGTDAAGRCAFFEIRRGTCAIHRQRGEAWLPTSCRLFPREAVIDARGTFVTLSHYCPTAARMLFGDDDAVHIVTAPAAFSPAGGYEGLDARDALPPLLRPGVLMGLGCYAIWERHMVATLGSGGQPEASLAALRRDVEAIRDWRSADGTLVDRVSLVCGALSDRRAQETSRVDVAELDLEVRRSVPHHLEVQVQVEEFEDLWAELVAAGWPAMRGPVGRYLAARAFASWTAYQGRGLRTVVHSLEAALAVLKMEVARACVRARRSVDDGVLLEAIRAADLLLVHLTSRETLARRWSEVERR